MTRNDSDVSGKLFALGAMLAAIGITSILDEQDKKKRNQAIEQATEAVNDPRDRFVLRTLLEDETNIEKLRKAKRAVVA